MSLLALPSVSGNAIAPSKQSGIALIGEADKTTSAQENKTTTSTSNSSSTSTTNTQDSSTTSTTSEASNSVQLSDKAKALVRSLQARDQQVRAHEQAHLAASGGLATSGATYTYQKGPDGVSYAIGGEVSIDVSPGRTPEDTIARAAIIRSAALAPADPSGQDRAVAAAASQMEQQARAELLIKASEELKVKVTNAYQDPSSKQSATQETNQGTRINEYA